MTYLDPTAPVSRHELAAAEQRIANLESDFRTLIGDVKRLEEDVASLQRALRNIADQHI